MILPMKQFSLAFYRQLCPNDSFKFGARNCAIVMLKPNLSSSELSYRFKASKHILRNLYQDASKCFIMGPCYKLGLVDSEYLIDT